MQFMRPAYHWSRTQPELLSRRLCGLLLCAVRCSGAPGNPPGAGNVTWSPSCTNLPASTICIGSCAPGFGGTSLPAAMCGADARWLVFGNCTPGEWGLPSTAGCSLPLPSRHGAMLRWLLKPAAAVICSGVPSGGGATWNASCSGRLGGSTCAGTCAAGSTGSPTAMCGSDARWAVSGDCTQGERAPASLRAVGT